MKSITLDLPYKVEPAKDGNRRNSRDLTSKKGDLMAFNRCIVHWIFRALECYTYCILFDIFFKINIYTWLQGKIWEFVISMINGKNMGYYNR